MPSALVINPNTSAAMTAEIEHAARRVFRPPWECVVAAAPAGPKSLEFVDRLPPGERGGAAAARAASQRGRRSIGLLRRPGIVPVKGKLQRTGSGHCRGFHVAGPAAGGQVRHFSRHAAGGRADGQHGAHLWAGGARYAGTTSLEIRVLDFDKDRAATLGVLARASQELHAAQRRRCCCWAAPG